MLYFGFTHEKHARFGLGELERIEAPVFWNLVADVFVGGSVVSLEVLQSNVERSRTGVVAVGAHWSKGRRRAEQGKESKSERKLHGCFDG